VVSPRNPLKKEDGLAPDLDRLRMVEIAVSEELGGLPVRVCDVEFGLPRPSYTVDTLEVLEERFSGNEFSLLVGADIIPEIDRWKEYEKLLANYRFYVYPRQSIALDNCMQNIVYLQYAPVLDFSSTDVRRAVVAGGDISGMVSPGVADYIAENGLWS
jgi:nicotinate-nucleotide adenylyltransferase